MTNPEFDTFIEKEGKAVYSFCRALAGNREEADDLFQETMLTALEHRESINASDSPRGFLNSIAVGIYRNNRRKYARRQRIAPVGELTEELRTVLRDEGRMPEEQLILRELQEIVRAGVRELPDRLRLPVYLYYTAQLSLEEISQILRIPKGTVKSRLHKARDVMRKRLEDLGYEDRKGN